MTLENGNSPVEGEGSSVPGGNSSGLGTADGNNSGGVVPLDAHDRLLSEKKRVQAERDALAKKLAEIEAAGKAAEEDRMRENQQWKELAERKQAELERTNTLRQAEMDKLEQRLKKEAFVRVVGGLAKPHYDVHIPVEEIKTLPDGSIDESHLKFLAEKFVKDNPELVRTGTVLPTTKAPSQPGEPNLSKMSSSEIMELIKNQAKG